MPSKNQNLVGKRFGELVVLCDSKKRGVANAVYWECRCDCGRCCLVTTAALNSGHTRSCGHIKINALKQIVNKRVTETPDTNYSLLNDKRPKTNTSGEKNITIVYRNGRTRFRVAVVYKKHQYGGLRDTMEEAIELREQLRREHWPNYKG